jgi:hypothetical protein
MTGVLYVITCGNSSAFLVYVFDTQRKVHLLRLFSAKPGGQARKNVTQTRESVNDWLAS